MFRPSILDDNSLDIIVDDFFNDSFTNSSSLQTVSAMHVDISETPTSYQIDMELPGFTKADIRAELRDGYLIVRASRKEEIPAPSSERHYIKKERYWGQYQRSFYVGKTIREKDIKAVFTNGLLTLTFPKFEKKRSLEESSHIEIEG